MQEDRCLGPRLEAINQCIGIGDFRITEAADITAGTECAVAGSSDCDASDCRICREFAKDHRQSIEHVFVDRIVGVGAIEDDRRHAFGRVY